MQEQPGRQIRALHTEICNESQFSKWPDRAGMVTSELPVQCVMDMNMFTSLLLELEG